jgi:hypothetical protein
MSRELTLRPEAFVEFLNLNLSGELRPVGVPYFELRDRAWRGTRGRLGMSARYKVVYDNMNNPLQAVTGGRIERHADIWHSVGLVEMGNRYGSSVYNEERLTINVSDEIYLPDNRMIGCGEIILRRLFNEEEEAVGLIAGSDGGLAYEDGIWRFAD